MVGGVYTCHFPQLLPGLVASHRLSASTVSLLTILNS
jgi:hypothetical protein